MDTLFPNVAGLNVHLKSISCAVLCRQSSGKLVRRGKIPQLREVLKGH